MTSPLIYIPGSTSVNEINLKKKHRKIKGPIIFTQVKVIVIQEINVVTNKNSMTTFDIPRDGRRCLWDSNGNRPVCCGISWYQKRWQKLYKKEKRMWVSCYARFSSFSFSFFHLFSWVPLAVLNVPGNHDSLFRADSRFRFSCLKDNNNSFSSIISSKANLLLTSRIQLRIWMHFNAFCLQSSY